MSLLQNTGNAITGGGGDSSASAGVPLLLPSDLVGTSTYDEATGYLTVPDGAIVQLGDVLTLPIGFRASIRWPGSVATGSVHLAFCHTIDPELEGLGLELHFRRDLYITEQTGTLAAPTESRKTSRKQIASSSLPSTEWADLEYGRPIDSTESAPTWFQGARRDTTADGSSQAVTGMGSDWIFSTDPAPTAVLICRNDSGQPIEIDLGRLYVEVYAEARELTDVTTQTLHVFDRLNLAEKAIADGDIVNGVVKITGHSNVYQISGGAWVPNPPMTQTIFDTAHLGVWSAEVPYGFKGIDGATASTDANGRLVIDNVGTSRSFSLVQWVGSTFGRVAMVEAVVTRTAGAFSTASTSFWAGISEANEAGYASNPKGYFAWLTDSVVGSLYQDTTAGGFVGIANSQAHGQAGPTYNVALLAVPRAIDDGDTTSEGVFFAGVGGGPLGAVLSSIADHAAAGWDPDEVGFVAADYTLSLALTGSANTVTVGAVAVGMPAMYQY